MQALARWFRKQSTWIESQQASILSAAVIIFVANLSSLFFGLWKNRVLSATYVTAAYGQGNLLDAYWVAFRAPEFAYQLIVVGALSAAFVPLFTNWHEKDKQRAFDFANQTMFLFLAIFGLASIVIYIFAPTFVRLLTNDAFTTEQWQAATSMTRIMVAAQLLFGLSGFLSAMLQGTKRFIIPAFSPVFYNLGIILTTLFAHQQLGIYAPAWGTVLGAFFHMAIQLPTAWKIGFRWQWWPNWHREDLKQFANLTLPRTITIGLDQMSLWVMTFFGAAIGDLGLTMIIFAQQLMAYPIRLFGVPIGTAALPFLTSEQNDLTGFRQTVFRSLRQILFFAAPAAVLLIVLRVPLVRLAYGTDSYPWRATLMTAEAVGILSLSIGPQAATHLLARAFYALGNTVVPFFSSLGNLIFTIVLSLAFVSGAHWGIRGLAIALSVGSVAETLILFVALLFWIHTGGMRELLSSLARITTASFLMAITLFVFQRLLDLYVFETSRTLQLIQLTFVVTSLGSIVYLAFCWILQIEELTILQKIWHSLRHQWQKTMRGLPGYAEAIQTE